MAAMMNMMNTQWRSPEQKWTVPDNPLSRAPATYCVWDSEMFTVDGTWDSFDLGGPISISGSFNSAELENPAYPRKWEIEQGDLPDGEPYAILQEIPVKIVNNTDVESTATFEAANLSIGGIGPRDAFQALIYELLDMFDFLTTHEDELGPGPLRQLNVLKQYIANR